MSLDTLKVRVLHLLEIRKSCILVRMSECQSKLDLCCFLDELLERSQECHVTSSLQKPKKKTKERKKERKKEGNSSNVKQVVN